jgi:hypothetical protein
LSTAIGQHVSYVFISYSRNEQAYARRLAAYLRDEHCVPVWMDDEIAMGDRWDTVLQKKIDGCAALIVVMTPAAASSHWVAEEVAHARNLGKPVLPLLLDGKPFFGLATVHHEDVRGRVMPRPGFLATLRAAVSLTQSTTRVSGAPELLVRSRPRVPPGGFAKPPPDDVRPKPPGVRPGGFAKPSRQGGTES